MKFLDTNIILCYLTRDDENKASACLALLKRLQEGGEEAATSQAVITEVVYVLSSSAHYHLSHDEIRARLVPVLSLRGLKLSSKRTYLRALDVYVTYPFLDFEDALTVAIMERDGLAEVCSYDTDFDKVEGVKRVEA